MPQSNTRPLQIIITWENTEDGNKHYLVWYEQQDGSWLPSLVIEKPCGTRLVADGTKSIDCNAQQLIDAGRNCGPAWHQMCEIPAGKHYRATRDMMIPGTGSKLRWDVDHNSNVTPIELKDTICLMEIRLTL